MALNEYLKQTQRFLRDQQQRLVNPLDLIEYINRSRREIAERTQSIRLVPPVSGQITAITGMRISGKMSIGVRRAASGPMIKSRSARTTNV